MPDFDYIVRTDGGARKTGTISASNYNEAIEKLSSVRPTTLGQASRISGITPATISILRVQLKVQNSKAVND